MQGRGCNRSEYEIDKSGKLFLNIESMHNFAIKKYPYFFILNIFKYKIVCIRNVRYFTAFISKPSSSFSKKENMKIKHKWKYSEN
jgi:hypothetical protein